MTEWMFGGARWRATAVTLVVSLVLGACDRSSAGETDAGTSGERTTEAPSQESSPAGEAESGGTDGAELRDLILGDDDGSVRIEKEVVENGELQKLVDETPDGGTVTIPKGIYAHGFLIEGRKNLTVRAEPGSVWIVEHIRNRTVVQVADSEHVTIRGLGLLHDPGGRCSGDALEVLASHDVVVENNDLSGSGVTGVYVGTSANVRIRDNHIHAATAHSVAAYSVAHLEVTGNLIRTNQKKYDGIWRQGMYLNHAFGDVVVRGNVFVDNPSRPVTVELPEQRDANERKLPAPNLQISNNVFARNESPGQRPIAFESSGDSRDVADAAGRMAVARNCFEARGKAQSVEALVPAGSETSDNRVTDMEFASPHRVTSPSACRVDVARAASWIERFEERPDGPTHNHQHPEGEGPEECPWEK